MLTWQPSTRKCLRLVLALVAAWPTGCSPGDGPSVRITALSPAPVHQLGHLAVLGEGFGTYDETRSAVFVDGLCADVMAWDGHWIDVVVPSGVGVGARVVVVRRADGAAARHTVTVAGTDRPPAPRRCEGLLQGGTADVSSDDEETSLPLPDVLPDVPEGKQWTFVRVEDLSDNEIGRNPGADIDAIVVRKPGGVVLADFVVEYVARPRTPELDNPEEALGMPDTFPRYPDLSWCDIYDGTVALGGAGRLVVRMSDRIDLGDEIEVYERGGCFYAPGLTSLPEPFMVSIGYGDRNARPEDIVWVEVGEGEGPLGLFEVTRLP